MAVTQKHSDTHRRSAMRPLVLAPFPQLLHSQQQPPLDEHPLPRFLHYKRRGRPRCFEPHKVCILHSCGCASGLSLCTGTSHRSRQSLHVGHLHDGGPMSCTKRCLYCPIESAALGAPTPTLPTECIPHAVALVGCLPLCAGHRPHA